MSDTINFNFGLTCAKLKSVEVNLNLIETSYNRGALLQKTWFYMDISIWLKNDNNIEKIKMFLFQNVVPLVRQYTFVSVK